MSAIPEYLASEPSPLGLICLRRRELPGEPGTVITEITLDHQFLMGSLHTASERALARRAIELHAGHGLRVLVGGLGLGYTAHAVLQSERTATVEVVEYLTPVIRWFAEGLLPLSGELCGDPRLAVIEGDVYARLWQPSLERWDVILIDVDHSPDEPLGGASDSFYTQEGLRRAKRHLAPSGVLGVWSYAECSPFADALARVFAEVRVERVSFENRIVAEKETNWLFFARG